MFPLGFLDLIISKILTFIYIIISKILTFSDTLLSVRRPSRKTTVAPFPFTTATQRKDFI